MIPPARLRGRRDLFFSATEPDMKSTGPLRLPILACLLALPLARADSAADRSRVTDPDSGITLPAGFDAEVLYEVPESQGSWVAMAFDPKGRLIVSDQDDRGVFRVTFPKDGQPASAIQVESLPGFPYEPIDWGKRKVGGALGFLHAFDSLYMSTMKGLYRIRDSDGDDAYDDFKLLKRLNYGYEHSAHSIIPTADGKALYLVSGNYTRVPPGTPSLQPPVWAEDSLLSPLPDPMGHAVGLKAPGGWICRISPDGEDWKMIASGFRNPVDLALNREGELFTFDSDLEFDVGCPWYRPTRINHVTSAAEFGWRSGSAKWPEYFADSLGAAINVGPGSPTGISFGHHSNFPAEYQDKLFVCDWTFGTIYTIELEESGSSYTGSKKEFLHGSPLNIAAMRFGPDGAMYFVTGGRTTASRLYRVRHTGEQNMGTPRTLLANREPRALRHLLERYHDGGAGGLEAVEFSWPHLCHADRAIRYAARLAIENQPFELWRERVFSEKNPRAAIHASIALCRHGDAPLADRVLGLLGGIPLDTLGADDGLALLRAYSLCFMRLGKPSGESLEAVIGKLDPHFPANDDSLNAELCRVLSYLDAPSVVGKTIALMKATRAETVAYDKEMLERHEYGEDLLKMMASTPNTRNIHYAYCLRRVQRGWTLEHRRYFFGWLNDSLENSGGKSFAGYIRAIREDAIEHLNPEDAAAVAGLLKDIGTIDLSKLPTPAGPPGAWTVESAMKLFDSGLRGRDFENGRKMFSGGLCIACHRFGGSGGTSGPDLGSVGKRFSIRDILVAICEPSQSISEQYLASVVSLKDGSSLHGRLIYRNDKEIAVAPNPFNHAEFAKAPADQVVTVEYSQTSLMPPGTIAAMNADEVKDLIAYLVSGGDPKHEAFQAK
jgi:putative heme-binding domain-containing protein